MDIAFINEVLVKLQHIQTAVSTQTRTQMIDDGELCSVCDRLRAVCQVVNKALDRILDPPPVDNEDDDIDSCPDDVLFCYYLYII
jgi:hypothetical protein